MRGLVVALLLALLLALTGCTSGAPPSTTAATHPPESAAVEHQERIVVRWFAHGERWPTVLSIPYGGARNLVGVQSEHGLAMAPTAFAVTPRGFAIVDPARDRVIEVSASGQPVRIWHDISPVASDIAWDQVNDRLIVIADESRQTIAELLPDGRVRRVTLDWAPFRLASTDLGVVVNGYTETPDGGGIYPVWTTVPFPLRAFPLGATDSRLDIGEHEQLVVRSTRRDGGSWQISVPGVWRTGLDLESTSRPRRVVTALNVDMSVQDDRVLLASLAGSFSDINIDRPLILVELARDTGELRAFHQVDPCGMQDETLQAAYIATAPRGPAYQLCVGEEGIQIRREPR